MKDFFRYTAEKTTKSRRKPSIKIIIIIILISILILIVALYVGNENARSWVDKNILRKEILREDVISIDINSNENTETCTYNKSIAVLNNNTLKIYNSSGREEKKLEMKITKPIFEANNRFLAIAEKNGQDIYFISGQDIIWDNKVEGNISKVYVNKNGYTAVVITNTSYKSVVSLYSPEGSELFKTFLASTGVVDVSISNDNKYLAIAEIDTSGTMIQSNVRIKSIEKARTDPENSTVFTHNADANKLIINIEYQDKNKLVCMYSDSIDVIENDKNSNLINLDNKKITFSSVQLNNNIAITEEQSAGLFNVDTVLKLTNVANQKENIYRISETVKDLYANGNVVALNLGTEIHFVNTNGWLLKKYISNQEITNVIISEGIAGVLYRDKIEIINI